MVDGSNRPQVGDVDDGLATSISGPLGASTPAGTAVLAETVLDRRYRLMSALTTRGPVTLWRGDDNVLTRPVAVRIVEHDQLAPGDAPPGADHEQAARRLLAAAINSGRLVHPGAASTYDATTTTSGSRRISYVVSEWVDGRTLRQLTAQGPLRPEQAGAVVLAAARVIAAAHERGIHHGDLNPGDVIVSSHGTVKIIDLEIGGVLAQLERAGRPSSNGDHAAAPEAGEASDPEATQVSGALGPDGPAEAAASDLRALGGLLYAGLTGHWPLGNDPSLPGAPLSGGRLRTPRQLTHTVPRDLDAITMAALGDDRAGEPITTAAELVEELESINPVDAVLDTGLMSLGDAPPNTEAMDVDSYDSTGYQSANYPSQNRYSDTTDYPGPGQDRRGGRYDDRGGRYDDRGGYQDGSRGGFDTRGGYNEQGYPPGRGGYPPSDRQGSGPGRDRGGHSTRGPGRSGSSLTRLLPWIALVVILIVIAVVAVVALNGDNGKGGQVSPTSTAPGQLAPTGDLIRPAVVDSFDPNSQGRDKTEKPGEVRNATDGDKATVWHTESYVSAQFGGLKPGVGLRFDFGQAITPSNVTVQVGPEGPVSFELRSASAQSDSIEGYQTVVSHSASASDTSGMVQLPMPSDLKPARYWVLWLTALPAADGGYRGSIAEIAFHS
ncbi:serine/threonine protein kinase [Frankia sp. AgPm24]|uniref:protein kinase family protein n=1 Tax=Frankia sp. AgPm24 TaxID=631128 RepID=UPI002010BDC3|nr:protein kinase family protein [Frankia sp. AgPm24]MCK9920576.1 serine/threonine protein kinase [Frankia sp. AgPm24]